ncbi:hypothetical protein L3Q82_012295 [Scortum barcoo]|uniref:Uncharacterized protein n=1 Tax=Scortum barcoo TaxID=214431 RepID=A0ACB8W3A8_9TELE|nr:hypothetical protein L3Q82_012295 [Scortum barcoo]
MDSIESSDLERAEAQTSTSTEPSQELVSSPKEDISQLPATVTISSELVEDLLRPADAETQPTEELHWFTPGPATTAGTLPAHECSNFRDPEAKSQVRKQLVRKEPELLSFIPHHIVEAVLTTYKAESAAEPTPCQTPGDEELFSQFLPESVMEDMFEQHGSWIRHTKIFQRAFPRLTDQEVLEYQQRISEPRLSNRDVVWVDKKYFVADFYEEKTETDYSSLLRNLPTYDSGDHGLLSSPKESLKAPQLCLYQLMAGDCPAVGTDVFTDKALVKKSTIRCVLVELFKCRDKELLQTTAREKPGL